MAHPETPDPHAFATIFTTTDAIPQYRAVQQSSASGTSKYNMKTACQHKCMVRPACRLHLNFTPRKSYLAPNMYPPGQASQVMEGRLYCCFATAKPVAVWAMNWLPVCCWATRTSLCVALGSLPNSFSSSSPRAVKVCSFKCSDTQSVSFSDHSWSLQTLLVRTSYQTTSSRLLLATNQ